MVGSRRVHSSASMHDRRFYNLAHDSDLRNTSYRPVTAGINGFPQTAAESRHDEQARHGMDASQHASSVVAKIPRVRCWSCRHGKGVEEVAAAFPFLTTYDPPGSSEGSLDPLGLYQIADQLAMQLVPAVRERMLRIRFLTAMTVGSLVTEDLDGDPRHPDAAPYLVWEWLVVEALTREMADKRVDVGRARNPRGANRACAARVSRRSELSQKPLVSSASMGSTSASRSILDCWTSIWPRVRMRSVSRTHGLTVRD